MISENLHYVLPEVFILLTTCALLLGTVFSQAAARLSYYGTQVILLGAAALIHHNLALPEHMVFEGHFWLDPLSSVMKLFTVLILFVVLAYGRAFVVARGMDKPEYYILLLFALLGLLLMISGGSLLTLYLGLELLSLPLYALVCFGQEEPVAVEAALKYFVQGALASGILLFGISFVFGVTGSLDLPTIARLLSGELIHNPLLWVGLLLITGGILFKLGGVPFHMWLPDVYTGAPLSVTAVMATVPKLAAFMLAYRVLVMSMPSLIGLWSFVMMASAGLSVILGNLAALMQVNLKRLLAYSAIAHVGFLLFGFGLGTLEGMQGALFYALVYILMTPVAFGVLLSLSSFGDERVTLDQLKGLSQEQPWMAFLMLLAMFSLAGIPPTAGFFAKFAILEALVDAGLTGVAVMALLFSMVGIYYYLRVVKVMYFDTPDGEAILQKRVRQGVPRRKEWVLSVNALLILILGLYPSGVMTLIKVVLGP